MGKTHCQFPVSPTQTWDTLQVTAIRLARVTVDNKGCGIRFLKISDGGKEASMYQAGSELAIMASCKVTFAPPNNCSLVHRRVEQCSLLYPEDNEQCVFGFMIKYAPGGRNQTIVRDKGNKRTLVPQPLMSALWVL